MFAKLRLRAVKLIHLVENSYRLLFRLRLEIFLFDQRHELCNVSEKFSKKCVIYEFKEPTLDFRLCDGNQLCKILDLLVISDRNLFFLVLNVFTRLLDLVVSFNGFDLCADSREPFFQVEPGL